MSSSPIDDYPASERDGDCSPADMLPTPPSTHTSRSTSPTSPDLTTEGADTPETPAQSKKKKKKKAKKSAKAKEASARCGKAADGVGEEEERDRPPVLCISRNKHWRYISSYHVRLHRFVGRALLQHPLSCACCM